ncbi:hypothetical protein AU197_21190 [Mycobacterium sp. IS-1590]|nr:hypothetical protein AU197_21190 [Mycobacterium sp. IS-1590]
MDSRTVDWWSVHIHVEPLLREVECWPMVGTLPWQHLPTDDPKKLAAIFDAARHWALRVDTSQAALAEASREVSASVDWSRTARTRSGVYIPRRVA